MNGLQPKKMLILYILEILKRYTDASHPMTQKEILNHLESDYGMEAERKAVKRNLDELIAAGYPVRCGSESKRSVQNPETGAMEDSVMSSDFYYEHEFTDGELRLLIDSLLFSKHIPYSQCKQLVEKLEDLSINQFNYRVRHIRNLPENQPENKQLFYTIEVLDEAISTHKQVAVTYNGYQTDKKLHPHLDETGAPRRIILNPYQMVATNGRYYLLCNADRHDDIANYRLDRITDIELLETSARPLRDIKGMEHGMDLPKHMAEHLYMFTGESILVTFRAKKYLLNDIIDWFGKEIRFSNETDTTVDVQVRVNATAMRMWAMQYALHTEILEPTELRETIINDLADAAKQYVDNMTTCCSETERCDRT